MNFLKDIPTHVWLVFICLVLISLYYVRPDPITVQLVNGFFAALLLSLNPRKPEPPQNP